MAGCEASFTIEIRSGGTVQPVAGMNASQFHSFCGTVEILAVLY
jgi:hypothetical protein